MSTPEQQPVQAARRLAEQAAEQAATNEAQRRLAPELVEAVAAAGLFRLCVPASCGGLEAHPEVLVQAVEALARGDASAAWCVAVSATSGLLAGYLPHDAASEIYSQPSTILGGVFAPKGRGVITEDGYRVSGRWPFASGCEHCDWLMGGTLVEDGGEVQKLPNGMPDVRLMLAPAREVLIHDTWRVSGLRATASHEIEFAEVQVARQHSASVFSDPAVEQGPLYSFPLFGMLAIAIAGVALGTARGALDDLLKLAPAKTPTGSMRLLAERSAAQAEIARAEAGLRAARALLFEAVASAWSMAVDRGEMPVQERASLRLAATHATTVAAEVTQSAYRLGGASVIYETSPLQRRFRDVNVATAHMLVGAPTWELVGRVLLGVPTEVTQL